MPMPILPAAGSVFARIGRPGTTLQQTLENLARHKNPSVAGKLRDILSGVTVRPWKKRQQSFVDHLGIHSTFLPMLLQPVDLQPMHLRIPQRLRLQAYLGRQFLPPAMNRFHQERLHLLHRLRMVLVSHPRPDQMRQLVTVFRKRSRHHIRRLLLLVLFA